jgi:hypothetical protein
MTSSSRAGTSSIPRRGSTRSATSRSPLAASRRSRPISRATPPKRSMRGQIRDAGPDRHPYPYRRGGGARPLGVTPWVDAGSFGSDGIDQAVANAGTLLFARAPGSSAHRLNDGAPRTKIRRARPSAPSVRGAPSCRYVGFWQRPHQARSGFGRPISDDTSTSAMCNSIDGSQNRAATRIAAKAMRSTIARYVPKQGQLPVACWATIERGPYSITSSALARGHFEAIIVICA